MHFEEYKSKIIIYIDELITYNPVDIINSLGSFSIWRQVRPGVRRER